MGSHYKEVTGQKDAEFQNSHGDKRRRPASEVSKEVISCEIAAMESSPRKKRRLTSTKEMRWPTRLKELQEFQQNHGHCRVPQKYPLNPSLGMWVAKMRAEFKKRENGEQSSITAERIAELNNLGFDWNLNSLAWELRMEELREFHQTHDHCRVPRKYPQNPSLGMWVAKMRAEFKKRENGEQSSMTAERIAVLNGLGFDWDANSATWEKRLQELRDFHKANGHCRVPSKYSQNPSLGIWVVKSRKLFKRREPSMTAGRIAELNNLGFDWDVDSVAWETRLQELRDFHKTNGHCRVPRKYPQNPSLGIWVSNMRAEFKKRKIGKQSSMTAERIAELNSLGFDWDAQSATWETRLQELRDFHKTNGHCRVPHRYQQNPSLGIWVATMRTQFKRRENGKQSSMTTERIAILNSLGFDWDAQSVAWETRLQELRDYKKVHGHCRVPRKYPQNPALGVWVGAVRKQFKRREPSMTAGRIAELNNLGFDWDLNSVAWETRLQELQEFLQSHGHCRVPQKYPQNPSLGMWVSNMRAEFKKLKNGELSSMTAERIAELNNLGFDWNAHSVTWETRLQELQKFHQTHGHCKVPRKYPLNPSLGMWVSKMRTQFKRWENGEQSCMTAERIADLNNLGFDWGVDSVSREIRSQKRQIFHQAHGHHKVPQKSQQNPYLGIGLEWMRKRLNMSDPSLAAERILELNNLGLDCGVNSLFLEKRLQVLHAFHLQELHAFHQMHGHSSVPRKYPEFISSHFCWQKCENASRIQQTGEWLGRYDWKSC